MKGLKEAGEDDSIGAVVLRIDSGGGGVSVLVYHESYESDVVGLGRRVRYHLGGGEGFEEEWQDCRR